LFAPRAIRTKSAPIATADDLRRIKGIGPVYAGRLGDLGVDTFSGLIAADSEQLAADLDVSVASVVEWKTQATAFLD
jgi:predicted flap endonuclease-1-like 5' DNA nuclease